MVEEAGLASLQQGPKMAYPLVQTSVVIVRGSAPCHGGGEGFLLFSFPSSVPVLPLQTRKSSSSQRFISIQNALDVPAEAPPGLAALVVSDAIRRAMQKAEVQLLQPVMRLEVIAEDGDVGAVTTDIRCRLGRACALLRCLLQVGHG